MGKKSYVQGEVLFWEWNLGGSRSSMYTVEAAILMKFSSIYMENWSSIETMVVL